MLKKSNTDLTVNNLSKLNELLPHGSKKIIAQRLNIRYNTVSDVFYGRIKSRSMILKIMKEAIDIIRDFDTREKKLNDAVDKLLN
jgi:hypothetical protein